MLFCQKLDPEFFFFLQSLDDNILLHSDVWYESFLPINHLSSILNSIGYNKHLLSTYNIPSTWLDIWVAYISKYLILHFKNYVTVQ